MTAFLKANSNYTVKNEITNTNAKVSIVVGAEEQSIMIRSAKQLHEMIPDSSLAILENRYHGEYSINHGMSYAEDVKNFLQMIT